MKKFIQHLFISLFLLASPQLFAKHIVAYLSYSTFYIPGKGPYVETHISVIGNSVVFKKNKDGKFQGKVQISLAFTQNDSLIHAAKKYNLLSPEIPDTTKSMVNFMDEQRFPLANGDYDLEISIKDINQDKKPFVTHAKVHIDYPANKIKISDIELLASYNKTTKPGVLTRSGYDLIPYMSNFYPESVNDILFYAEVYNTNTVFGKDKKYVLESFIQSYETGVKLKEFGNISVQKTDSVSVLLADFPIKTLPSGNYYLLIEVHDSTNKMIADKKIFFQRQNSRSYMSLEDLAALNIQKSFTQKITNKDTLMDDISCLRPISSRNERRFAQDQLKGGNIKLMQQYFLNFWLQRNSTNPQKAWLAYDQEVKKVNAAFGTHSRKGYETDRGRVYLEYGPPNSRDQSTYDPDTYPYEIWQYNKVKGQTNGKFVFYEPDVGTNNYILLHSNVTGEIHDRSWQLHLHKRDNFSHNVDDETVPNNFGDHVSDEYNNPR